jgi:hypothetical protein
MPVSTEAPSQAAEAPTRAAAVPTSRIEVEAHNSPSRLKDDGIVERLEKLVSLHDSGVLTDDEFERAKGRLLGG